MKELSYIKQEEFDTFFKRQRERFRTLSIEEQNSELRIYMSKKWEAEDEKDLNLIIQKENEDEFQNQQKKLFIEYIKNLDYLGDGSLTDYKRFFNRPETFGANWEQRAIAEHETAEDKLENFIQLFLRG